MKWRRAFLSFLAGSIILAYNSHPVFACTPVPKTPWFSESVSIPAQDLPEGIQVIKGEDDHAILENSTGKSIYVQAYQESNEIKDKYIVISASGGGLFIDGYWVTDIEDRNIIQDNRPQNVELPKPQDSIIPIRIDDKSYLLQVSVGYDFNPYYDPNSVKNFAEACRFYPYGIDPFSVVFVALIGLVIFTIIMILITRKQEKNISEQD